MIISNSDGIDLRPSTTIVVKLTVRNLNAIGLSGDGNIDARGIPSDQLRISVSGDGKIEAAGNAETQEIKVSGDGSYMAEQLTSKVARVQISETARLCWLCPKSLTPASAVTVLWNTPEILP